MIDPLSPTPVYRQIADAIAERIDRGDLQPNRPIPSETALRQEFGVARETARRAVADLRERGLVFTVPQRGTYVAESTKDSPRTVRKKSAPRKRKPT
jgi:GntR family transcriptional regulator